MHSQTPTTPDVDSHATLAALSQALQREIHVLSRRPELLWQQMYNRLQWEPEPLPQVLAPEFSRRNTAGTRPWLKHRKPPPESGAFVRTLESPVGAVRACAVTPDGDSLLSVHTRHFQHKHNIFLWDLSNGQIKTAYSDPAKGEDLVALSPDGSWFLVGNYWTVSMLDTATGAQRLELKIRLEMDGRYDQGLSSLDISPDGAWFLTASKNQPFIRRWDARTGAELARYEGQAGYAKISPDGRTVLHAYSSSLRAWDVPSGKMKYEIPAHYNQYRVTYATACAFGPDGTWALSAGSDGVIKAWDLADGQARFEIQAHTGRIHALAVSPDGRFFVSAGEDRNLKVWDTGTGVEMNTLVGHTGEVNHCAVGPNGRTIFSAGAEGTLKVWDAYATGSGAAPQFHTDDITDCTFSRDGSLVATTSLDRTVKLWDGATGVLRTDLGEHYENATCCAIHPHNLRVVSGGADRKLKLWQADNGNLEATLEGHSRDGIQSCAFSPDGRWIVSLGGDFRVWDADKNTQKYVLAGHEAYGGPLGRCQIDMGGHWVLHLGRLRLTLWKANVFDSGKRQTLGGHYKRNYAFAISPDGRWIITAGADHTLKVCSINNGRVVARLKGHTGTVTSCAVSPDGRILVSASNDRTYRVWDLEKRKAIQAIPGQIDYPAGGPDPAIAAISPDGSFFVSAFLYDLTIWDTHSGGLRARLGESGPACAVSPDGRWVFTLREMLRVWEAASGELQAEIPLAGLSAHLSAHPSLPYLACGKGSNLFLLDLVSLDYGPLVITAFDAGSGPSIQCPSCRQVFPIQETWLGTLIPCPGQGCTAQLQLNPGILKRAEG